MNFKKFFLNLVTFLLLAFCFVGCDDSSDSEWSELSYESFKPEAGTYDFVQSTDYSQDVYGTSMKFAIKFEGNIEITGTEDNSDVKSSMTSGFVGYSMNFSDETVYDAFKSEFKGFSGELSEANFSFDDKNFSMKSSYSYTQEQLASYNKTTTYSELLNDFKNNNVKVYISDENPGSYKIEYVEEQDVEGYGEITVPVVMIFTKR